MTIDPLNFSNPTAPPVEAAVVAPAAVSNVASGSTSSAVTGNASESGRSTGEQPSPFGPAYRLDEPLKTSTQVMGVPFSSISPAQALASLPPINAVGVASLTEISLQNMIQPPAKRGSVKP